MDQELLEHQLQEERRLTEIEGKLQTLEKQITELQTDIKDLVEAWKAANGIVSFVKWVAGIITAVGVIWAVFKGGH